MVSTSQLKTNVVFASLVILTGVGFALFAIVGVGKRLLIPWSSRERDEVMGATGM